MMPTDGANVPTGSPAADLGEVADVAEVAVEVDARDLRCPLPVLPLAHTLARSPAATVRLLANDPAARTDVPAFVRMRGLTLLEVRDEGAHTAYLVRGVSTTPAAGVPAARPPAAPGMPPAGPPAPPATPGAG